MKYPHKIIFYFCLLLLLIFIGCKRDKTEIIKENLKIANNIMDNDPLNNIKALPYYDKIINLDSDFQIAYFKKILILRDNKKFNDVIDVLKIMERRNIDKASTYWTLGMFYEYIGYIDSAFINYHKCLDYVFTKDTNDCINKLNFAICEKLLNDTLIYINPRCRMLDPQLFERLKWERKDFIASYLERTTNKRYNKK